MTDCESTTLAVASAAHRRRRPHGTAPRGKRSDTWLTYSAHRHHVHLSHAYTTLGETRRAHESQQRALELSAPTSTMFRTARTTKR
ncbi:hypothetical protein SGFS_004160 [Streptomyces graminofaciens]|uniref:Uncharacterized protein n=1 Tax=Streptomyces graminofaciens TaxID=68212 RepID=A0ABM7F0B9_9ACTN|nr:hypothetical protein SGFS_004160 [Streptomyces graminofaciens]